jgi:hypothetical protein
MRQIARLVPRLGILHNILFSISFSTRLQVFRSFIYSDVMAGQHTDNRRTVCRSRCTMKESLKTGSTAGDVEEWA